MSDKKNKMTKKQIAEQKKQEKKAKHEEKLAHQLVLRADRDWLFVQVFFWVGLVLLVFISYQVYNAIEQTDIDVNQSIGEDSGSDLLDWGQVKELVEFSNQKATVQSQILADALGQEEINLDELFSRSVLERLKAEKEAAEELERQLQNQAQASQESVSSQASQGDTSSSSVSQPTITTEGDPSGDRSRPPALIGGGI